MKKTYKIKNLDCANCALEMGDRISKVKGVKKAKVNFMLSKLTVEYEDDFELKKEELERYIKEIDSNSEII